MINPKTFTKEHFEALKENKVINPPILERALFALGLVEALRKAGMDFIFKGGRNALMLLLDKPMRLSTDVDILVEPNYAVEEYLDKVATLFPFLRKEESVRATNKNIQKRHFKFFFRSISNPENELSILLDVVYEQNPYPFVIKREVKNDLLLIDGAPIFVRTPDIDSILGDKLTAFAPHTIGVRFFNDNFSNDKRLEVIKQFYDIATLFDYLTNFSAVRSSYRFVADNELAFRDLAIDYKECLLDAYHAALTILVRGENGNPDYPNYVEGIRRIRGHIYGERFSSEIARLHAPKVMLLAACLYRNVNLKTNIFNTGIQEEMPLVKKIKSLGQAENTRRCYEQAVSAISLMK